MFIKNDRNIYIDVLKGLLMILVVIGHLNIFDYNARSIVLIYSFHMPAFLIIGGYLSKINNNNSYINIIKKRFISCIIPYFIFNIISLILFHNNINIKETIETILLGVGNPDYAINLPTWFLTFYFSIMTLYDIIKLYATKTSKNIKEKNIKILIFVIICVIIGRLTHRYFRKVMWPPYNIQQALFCMPFVYVGDMINNYQEIFTNKIKKFYKNNKNLFNLTVIILFIIIFIAWYKLSLLNGRIDMNARDYKNKILFFINAILGMTWFSFFAYLISKIPYINKLLSYIGKNSIYILGYHIIAFSIILIFFNKFINENILLHIQTNKYLYILYYTTLETLLSLLCGKIHRTIFNNK